MHEYGEGVIREKISKWFLRMPTMKTKAETHKHGFIPAPIVKVTRNRNDWLRPGPVLAKVEQSREAGGRRKRRLSEISWGL